MLMEAYPDLANSTPGEIQAPDLPNLRNLIVVNLPDPENATNPGDDKLIENTKCVIDWREMLVWTESAPESRVVKRLSTALEKDDIINLQFTR